MTRRIVFKIALVLVTATAVFLLARPRSPDLLTLMDPAFDPWPADRLTGLGTTIYDRHDVALWSDRSYHTFQFVRRLAGLGFVPTTRNGTRPYVLHATRPTTLFTIANRLELAGVGSWKMTDDTVLVDDTYPPRRFDALLMREVDTGHYVIRSRQGGPSKPVFFDPQDVTVVQR